MKPEIPLFDFRKGAHERCLTLVRQEPIMTKDDIAWDAIDARATALGRRSFASGCLRAASNPPKNCL